MNANACPGPHPVARPQIALEREVQELLASWASHIAAADLIFAQAPSSNARSLFSEGQTTLLQSNPRLRRVPFVTHRPTFSETKRVLRLLCAVFRPDAVDQLLQAQHSSHAEVSAPLYGVLSFRWPSHNVRVTRGVAQNCGNG